MDALIFSHSATTEAEAVQIYVRCGTVQSSYASSRLFLHHVLQHIVVLLGVTQCKLRASTGALESTRRCCCRRTRPVALSSTNQKFSHVGMLLPERISQPVAATISAIWIVK